MHRPINSLGKLNQFCGFGEKFLLFIQSSNPSLLYNPSSTHRNLYLQSQAMPDRSNLILALQIEGQILK